VVEHGGSGSEIDASGDDEPPPRHLTPSARRSVRRVTRPAKTTDFMQPSAEVDSDDLDFSSEAAGEDLALIAGAAENDEEEAADLEAAINASLAIVPSPPYSPGTSRAPSTSRAAMAAMRALAAEKRAGASQVVDDRDAWSPPQETSSELSSDELDSDFTGRKNKNRSATGKGKGNGKGKTVTIWPIDEKKSTSIEEMKAMRRRLREERRALLAPLKREERIMRGMLGRRLTHV
jgi:hypothetical protein